MGYLQVRAEANSTTNRVSHRVSAAASRWAPTRETALVATRGGVAPINARGASACASAFAARSAPGLLRATPASRVGRLSLQRFRCSASASCALVLIAGCLRVFDASRRRRLGFFAGSCFPAGSPSENASFSHLLETNCRISSSEGSAPKMMRTTPYLSSSTCSASPTQNWPSVYGQGGRHADLHGFPPLCR